MKPSTLLRVSLLASTVAAALPTVTIPNGVLIGTTTRIAAATADVNKFLGVPFAAKPVRFAPPVDPPSWTSPRLAQKTSAACYQQFKNRGAPGRTRYLFDNPGGPPLPESEDCLYINVFAPPNAKAGDKKAVLFQIFGGNFVFGAGTVLYYDGSSLAYNQDVVVVTFNARTNVFGFPGSPQIPLEKQNLGLLDQRFALEWVQKNIAAFGGDPKRVTIFGQSSGGYSVKQLIAFPPNPLTFHSGIAQSQAAADRADGDAGWNTLVGLVNCDKSADKLACVRGKDGLYLRDVVANNSLPFFPVDDGVTHSGDVEGRFRSGQAAKVPFMTGSLSQEARAALWVSGAQDRTDFPGFLNDTFPNNPAIRKVLQKMFGGKPYYEATSAIASFFVYQCTTARLARVTHAGGLKTYRYLYWPSFPDLQRFPMAGCWHSSELPVLWDNVYLQWGPATQQQVQMVKYLQQTWANFAKDPSKPPQPNWPEVGFAGKILNIGKGGSSGGSPALGSNFDTLCQILSPALPVGV